MKEIGKRLMPQPACQSSSDGLSDLKSPAFNCCILFLPEVSTVPLPAGKTSHIPYSSTQIYSPRRLSCGDWSSHIQFQPQMTLWSQSPQVNVSSSLLNSEVRDSHVT